MVKKLDKYAYREARAKEVIARERARQEKRKNGLPPFLMVRSGLLNSWIWTLGAGAGFAWSVLKEHEGIDGGLDKWTIVFCILLAVALYYGAIKTDLRRDDMKNDIQTIQKEFYLYMKNSNYTLEFSKEVQNKKLMRILIEHIVKYDPGIFDKMIATPESIDDFDVRNDIISGHLKNHSADAQKVIDTFDKQEISAELYEKVRLYATRLVNSEKNR